jgi:maltooligosyltrehalose trehalohydrolase
MPEAPLGATWRPDHGTTFEVWAPRADTVEVVLDDGARLEPMTARRDGTWATTLADVGPGDRYRYRLHRADGGAPSTVPTRRRAGSPTASTARRRSTTRASPGPTRGFAAPPLHEQVSTSSTSAPSPRRAPSTGSSSTSTTSPSSGSPRSSCCPCGSSPGTATGATTACCRSPSRTATAAPTACAAWSTPRTGGLAVMLDVVYNHIGPEGNHLADFGPYFSDPPTARPGATGSTPTVRARRRASLRGRARRGWVRDFHLDGFRLDAVHGIVDSPRRTCSRRSAAAVQGGGRTARQGDPRDRGVDLCDARLLRSRSRRLRAGRAVGRRLPPCGPRRADRRARRLLRRLRGLGDLAPAPRPLRLRRALLGLPGAHRRSPAPDVPYDRFVVCVQNHDQVGNRMLGERLTALTDLEGCKLAAARCSRARSSRCCSWARSTPSRPVPVLRLAHRPGADRGGAEGRREEFAYFAWQGEAPDPQDPKPPSSARRWTTASRRPGRPRDRVRALYRHLIALRRELPLLSDPDAPDVVATLVPGRQTLVLSRIADGRDDLVRLNADGHRGERADPRRGLAWTLALDTADERWSGPARPASPGASTHCATTVPHHRPRPSRRRRHARRREGPTTVLEVAATLWPGASPTRSGATYDGYGTNFAVFSEVADKVELCLFHARGPRGAHPAAGGDRLRVARLRTRRRTRTALRLPGPRALRPQATGCAATPQAAARPVRQGRRR